MKRRHPAVGLALAVPVLLMLAVPVPAKEQVPFRGRLEGSVLITPLSPTLASVDLEATGNASHLGLFTVSGIGRVDFAANVGVTPYTFTAANGDTLTATSTGHAMPTEDPEVIIVTETVTITGGTGRFAGATGGFILVRHFDFATGETTGTFEGTISSVGASKR
jgi:hypothetical protein